MKNRKGFTLIELLAVIVILAIIALIAVPVILNMIGKAKVKASEASALGYIDAVEHYIGLSQAEAPGYDVKMPSSKGIIICYKKEILGWNELCRELFEAIDAKTKGKKPTEAVMVISSGGKVLSGSQFIFNNIKGTYNGKSIELVENSNTSQLGSNSSNNATSNNIVTYNLSYDNILDEIDWDTIIEYSKDKDVSQDLIGTGKTITMDVNGDNENETYHIMVVNTSECTTETSESACGLVLQFKELLNITNDDDKKMNLDWTGTNAGGWPASDMHTYLNTTIYNKLPSDLKAVIIPTKTISGHEKDVSANYTSVDKLYLLSSKEVGFNVNYDSAKTETRKLDYYDAGTGIDAKAKRVKYNYGTTKANSWWLRSAHSNSASGFSKVNAGGSSDNNGAFVTNGVAPSFRIGTD